MKTLYNVYYTDQDESKLFGHMRYETTTDNFDKWLEEHNAQRIEEGNEREDADTFEVKPISLSLYDDKIKSFKIYTDDTDEDKILDGDDIDTALEILENNGYIVEVEYENENA